jgi:hypothetical protein
MLGDFGVKGSMRGRAEYELGSGVIGLDSVFKEVMREGELLE